MPALSPRTTILIAGPTASGKSALAIELAERFGGTVVNADSMQVYRELRVLTARPPDEDEARVPHRLYGHVPATEAYSAGRFAREAERVLAELRAEGRVPIIVGGTGLYFKSLIEGLVPVPDIPAAVRGHWRSEQQRIGAAALHAVLSQRDPDMAARLRPSDPQRIVRALEVLDATGRSLADWQREPGRPIVDEAQSIRLVIAPEREELNRRADARFQTMVRHGAVEEVRRLAGLGLDPALPVMRALGVGPLMQLASGEITLEAAVAAGQAETRQFIRRQMTWLRRNMITWQWQTKKEMESLQMQNYAFIQSTR